MTHCNTTRHPAAVVDWVELEIQTARSTNFMTVQKELRRILRLPDSVNPHVKAQGAGSDEAATVFRFRLQAPERHRDVEDVIRDLSAAEFGCVGSPRITAIEVAFDAYNAGAERAAMFSKFSTSPLTQEHCRMYRKKGMDAVQQMPSNFASLVRHLGEGWQISLGDDQADCHWHIYWKTTDNGGAPLPQSEWRARIEVTLRGAALPVQTLEDLSRFKFGSLSELFLFRKLKSDLTPIEQITADVSARIGASSTRNRKGGGTRLHSKLTESDTALNRRAASGLRELTRRWQATPKRGKLPSAAAVKNEYACGNKRENLRNNPIKSAKQDAVLNTYHVEDLINNLNPSTQAIEQLTEPHRQPDYDEAIGCADSLQSAPETDSSLEDTISFSSRCELLQLRLDTTLQKSLKIIADERTETRNKVSTLTTGQEAKQSEQPDT